MDVIILDELTNKIDSLNSGITSTVNNINTNVNEVKSVCNNIYSKVDTEVSTIQTNTNTNNSASATGTLSQKLSWIGNSLIGATSNTGGSSTTGTVMGKLNSLLTPIKTEYKSVASTGETVIFDKKNIRLYGVCTSYVTGGSSSTSKHGHHIIININGMDYDLGYGDNAYNDNISAALGLGISGFQQVKNINTSNDTIRLTYQSSPNDTNLNVFCANLKITVKHGHMDDNTTVGVLYS